MATVVGSTNKKPDPMQYTLGLLDLHQGAQRLQMAREELDFRRDAFEKEMVAKDLDRELMDRQVSIDEFLAPTKRALSEAQVRDLNVASDMKEAQHKANLASDYYSKSIKQNFDKLAADIEGSKAQANYMNALALNVENEILIRESDRNLDQRIKEAQAILAESEVIKNQLDRAFSILNRSDINANPDIVDSLYRPIFENLGLNESDINLNIAGLKYGALNSADQLLKSVIGSLDPQKKQEFGLAILTSAIYGKGKGKASDGINIMQDIYRAYQNDNVRELGENIAQVLNYPDNAMGHLKALMDCYTDPSFFDNFEILETTFTTGFLKRKTETTRDFRLKPPTLTDEEISNLQSANVDGETVYLLEKDGIIKGFPKDKINSYIAEGYRPYEGNVSNLSPVSK
jgi:hypothetical protein